MLSTNKHLNIKTGDYTIRHNECEKLSGVKIDVNLNFIIICLIFVKKLVERYLH